MKTRATEAKTTTNRQEIIQWAKERGGKPARVRGTGNKKNDAGLLRIDFPGGAGKDKLEPISWSEWFEKFKERKLQFLYQGSRKSGGSSTFFKLVNKGNASGNRKASSAKRPQAKKTNTKTKAKTGRAKTSRTKTKTTSTPAARRKTTTARRNTRVTAKRTSTRGMQPKRTSTRAWSR